MKGVYIEMKKIITCMLVCILIICNSMVVCAATHTAGPTSEPQNVYASFTNVLPSE